MLSRFPSRSKLRAAIHAVALGCLASSAAFAQDSYLPKVEAIAPDQAQCNALGEGFFAVKGSNACVRISGYVAAGAGFVSPVRGEAAGPFAAGVRSFSGSEGAVGVDSRFDTPLGPGRLYVEFGGQRFQP